MPNKFLAPVLIVVLAGLAFVALVASKPTHPPAKAQSKTWQVDAVNVASGQHAPVVSLFGSVESPHASRLVSAVSAEVVELLAHEGDAVAAGQLMLRLDEADYRLALQQRDAEVDEIRAQILSENHRHDTDQSSLKDDLALLALYQKGVKREDDLLGKNLGNQSRADDARKLLRQQALQVKQRRLAIREHAARLARLDAQAQRVRTLRDRAALDLDRTRIHAPYPGVITETLVAPGDRVRLGDGLFQLYDRDTMEVRAQLPSRYVDTIRQAVDNDIPLSAGLHSGERTIRVAVSRLAGRIRKGSGGLDVLFALGDLRHGLSLGQTVRLKLRLPLLSDVLALPAAALYGNRRVYVVDGDRLRPAKVQVVGHDADGRVLVRSADLRAGDPVITTQLPTAVEGLLVEINAGADPAPHSPGEAGLTAAATP